MNMDNTAQTSTLMVVRVSTREGTSTYEVIERGCFFEGRVLEDDKVEANRHHMLTQSETTSITSNKNTTASTMQGESTGNALKAETQS
jgi:hypothetical protein